MTLTSGKKNQQHIHVLKQDLCLDQVIIITSVGKLWKKMLCIDFYAIKLFSNQKYNRKQVSRLSSTRMTGRA